MCFVAECLLAGPGGVPVGAPAPLRGATTVSSCDAGRYHISEVSCVGGCITVCFPVQFKVRTSPCCMP